MPRLVSGLVELAADYDLVVCDVWGVIHNGVRHHPSAVEALRRFRARGKIVVLVTNAPAPRERVVARLDSLGVPGDAYDAVATSGDVTIDAIVSAGCPPLFHIGPAGETVLYTAAGRHGDRVPKLVSVDQAHLAICVGLDDLRVRPEEYDEILRRLRGRDVELLCANPDLVVEVGTDLVFCAGAIADRYTQLGGKVRHAGKPFPAIYKRAFALASETGRIISRQRTLAIGDAMRTDMRGAAEQGIAGLFITGGIHRAALHRDMRDLSIEPDLLKSFLKGFEMRPLAAMPSLAWS